MKIRAFLAVLGMVVLMAATTVAAHAVSKPSITVKETSYGIQVSWNAQGGVSQYKVEVWERRVDSAWTTVATLDSTTTSHLWTGVEDDTLHYVMVTAVLSSGTEIYSDYVLQGYKLTAPAAPVITATQDGDDALVSWDSVDGATFYRIFVSRNLGAWQEQQHCTDDCTSFRHESPSPARYNYIVVPMRWHKVGAYSNQAVVTIE